MKTKILSLSVFTFLSVFLYGLPALAVGSGALPVRHLYTPQGNHVMTWQYKQLVSSTVKGIAGMQVNNTGVHAVKLAFGAASGEVNQIIVGGNQDTGYIPVLGGYATRLSVIALDGPNETGELDVNVVYN